MEAKLFSGKFIQGNYKQALETLKKEDSLLRWMDKENVPGFGAFRIWLDEEKEFLLGLKAGSKDQTETLEMEYVQKLVNLDASRSVVLFFRTWMLIAFQCEVCRHCSRSKKGSGRQCFIYTGWRLSSGTCTTSC